MEGPSDWQSLAAQKRGSIDKLVQTHLPAGVSKDSIPAPDASRDGMALVRDLLGASIEKTDSALNGGISSLLADLAGGKESAVSIVTAFAQRAAIAHLLTNCLSEVLFDEAIARAKELDDHLLRIGKPIGPLHGLPISLKDQFRVQGAETSLGYVGWLGKIEGKEDESLIVQDLKRLGAIVLCKTNVPTALMALETNNNIIGTTLGARNRLLSSGGSSGGEAALLALGGAMVGLGSDIGASIRLPASINGIYGLKPSHGRLSYRGVANSMVGQEIINSVVGPLGHSIEDLEFLTRALLSTQPWMRDPHTLPLPWRQGDCDEVHRLGARRQLTFAVFMDDGVVKPHPPVTRVLHETVEKLRTAGHKVIEWSPPPHGKAFALHISFFMHDGGRDVHAATAMSGEPLIPQLAAFYGPEPRAPVKSVHEVWTIVKDRDDYRTAYSDYWNSTSSQTGTGRPVDFIILPCSATASFEKGKGMYMGYTGFASLLDYTSVTIRGGKVNSEVDVKVSRETFHGEMDRGIWAQYDPSLFDGTPIGIQVMGRRLEEERVLAAAWEVERCLA